MKKINKINKIFFLFALLIACCLGLIGCSLSKTQAPYIGDNGNWWIGSSDLGVKAQGEKGEKGEQGEQGIKGERGEKGEQGAQGSSGKDGENGKSVTVESCEKTSSEGGADTYTISFSDGTKATFSVNKASGGGAYIVSVEKTKTEGNKATYTITLSDKSSFAFEIINGQDGQDGENGQDGKDGENGQDGKDGLTPHIGENGNWWIGEVDTGVFSGKTTEVSEATDGLLYEVKSICGRTGMVVTGYDGLSQSVIIPNYIGSVPVIGISSDAFKCKSGLTDVRLSKNTVYIAPYAFSDCLGLKEVDFNGCEPTELPVYAFSGCTSLNSITIPSSVKKLGDYCFQNARLKQINYSNVTYFGTSCLNKYYGGYAYLSKNVEYVGMSAFESSYVYTEYETVPSSWGQKIAGTNELSSAVTANCKINSDYIYSDNGASVTVYRYIGKEKNLTVASEIGGVPVKTIGYGFNSINQAQYNIMKDAGVISDAASELSSFVNLQTLYELHLPSGVSCIDYGALACYGTMIFIPSSVSEMYSYAGSFLMKNDCTTSFLAFESAVLPSFKYGISIETSAVTEANWISDYGSYVRYSLGTDPKKVEYNEQNFCYYLKNNDDGGYSLLADMDLTAETLTICSIFNNLPVHTVCADAISGLKTIKNVIIEQGISKLRSYAFDNVSLSFVYIPLSVTTINANSFDDVCKSFNVEAQSKPSEWDSYWAGEKTSSVTVSYSSQKPLIFGEFVYSVSGDNAILLKYVGSSLEIHIPKTIEGKTVVKIKSGFLNLSGFLNIYMPSTVTEIEEKAFVFSDSKYYAHLYSDAVSRPSGWSANYFYYVNSGTYNCVEEYFGQTI